MTDFFRNISIRLKVILIQFLISVLGIGLCSIVFYYSSINSFRKSQYKNLESLAQVVAKNAKAALQFGMEDVATGLFSELKFDTNITNATIFDKKRETVRQYMRDSTKVYSFNLGSDLLTVPKVVDDNLYINYYYPIIDEAESSDDKYLGVVALRRYNREYNDFKNQYLLTSMAAMAIGLLLSLVLSVFMQRSIANPIKDLAEAARHISTTRDYKIRVSESGKDEITVLSQSFNEMLDQINTRDQSLSEAKDQLELRVVERTRQLSEMNAVLQQRTKALEATNRELEQFAYVTSHDLQEPLRSIGGFTQILEKKYRNSLDENAREYMHYIVEGVSRMQALIKDILIFSRLGRQSNEFRPVDFNYIVDMTQLNLQYAIQEKKAHIMVTPLPENLVADSTQIGYLFQNLLSNALKFTSDTVVPQIYISAREEEDSWLFSIKDNGIGIEKEYAHKIFLIFQRLHTKDKYPGTGIGLAICKKITEMHEGRIWFESEPGTGTCFYFTIKKGLKNQLT